MLQKLKKKTEVSFRRAGNSKGMTLVELVVAVAILAALSGILLHSFVTSMNLTKKARRISEATDAAQNIQEVIEAQSYADFLGGTDKTKSMLGISGDSSFVSDAETKTAIIKGIEAGKSTFDAKVIFDAGHADTKTNEAGKEVVDISTADGFYLINNKELSDYSDPVGTFFRSFEDPSQNPDMMADRMFVDDVDYKFVHSKQRTINIDITGDYEDGELTLINVDTRWDYVYSYMPKNAKDYTNLANLKPETVENVIDGSIVSGGVEPPESGKFATIYFMYYPSFTDETSLPTVDGTPLSASTSDIINVYNRENLPVRIMLIKLAANYGSRTKEQVNPDETKYRLEIHEYMGSGYLNQFSTSRGTADIIANKPKTVLTNAGYSVYGPNPTNNKVGSVTYYIHDGSTDSFNGLIDGGSLINKEKGDRLYDVTIELYEHTDSTELGELISSFKAGKSLN